MSSESDDTATSTLYVSVPSWQKAEWEGHASELDMSLSEFARSMIQAGRNGYTTPTPDTPTTPSTREDLKEQVLDILSTNGPLEWDAIVDIVTGELEDELEAALEEIQKTDNVIHSSRKGGYVVQET